ncbi:unnamed protein product [Plutella xylostella]|uniref:(diamondback moth) hypothetical protein n=1 Tax=Plutella xylostella TaxID=51655 RepID=A0A8S4FGP6_PLUXY|nr:unnamed protein product [Plutella xylostella]
MTSKLWAEIARQDPGLKRHPRESLRAFLLSSLAAPLDGHGQKLVHQFCDTYEYARHHPGDFGEEEYQAYSRLLLKLLDASPYGQFCDTYEYARHHPGDFGEEEYQAYSRLLLKLLDAARLIAGGGTRNSPRAAPPRPRRPADPARLRPPLPATNKLTTKRYTALENLPADSKLEDEIISVPVTRVDTVRDETAV